MAFTKITGPGIHTLTNIVSHNVKSSGIITAVNGNLNGWLAVGSTASFSGNVSIGGTLTYDDVTNVESVGLITAKNGIFIPDDKKLELGNAAGSGDLSIFYDSTPGESLITHTGPGVFKIEGNSSNNIFIRPRSGENSITAKPDKDVELYYNNELRFSTSGVGATIRDSAASGSGISNSLDLLNIGNHSGDGTSISFLRSPGNTRAQIIAVKNETSNNETDLVFKTTKNGGTLTESLRILGNTQNVGIGSTVPTAKLDVNGTLSVSGISTFGGSIQNSARILHNSGYGLRVERGGKYIDLNGDWAASGSTALNAGASGIRFYYGSSSDGIQFNTGSGIDKVRITSDGKVGIGTDNPNAPIHIQSSDNTLGILTSTDSGANLDLSDSDTMSRIRSVDGRLHLYADFGSNVSDSSIRFFVDGANEKVRITSDGEVGIGSDNPGHKLSILGSNNEGISLINSNEFGTAGIYLEGGRNAGTGVVGQLKFYNRLNSGVTSKFKVNGNGDFCFDQGVGIGLDNPTYKLHVYGGNVRFAQPAGTDITVDLQEATTTNPLRLMQTATEARIVNNASQPFNIRAQVGSGSTAHLAFWTRDSERLRITAPGNIGIGTSSPSGILHTYVDNATQRSYFQSSHGHSFIRTIAKSTNENSGLEFYSGSSNIANITGIGTGGLLFEVGGSERARIKSGNFAGITANGSFYHEEAGQTNGGDTQDKTIEFNRRGVFLVLISYSLGTTTTDINRNVYSLGLFVSRSNGATWVPVQQNLNSSHVGNLTISDGGARGKLRVEKSSGSDNRQCAFRIDVLSSADVRIIVTDT